jgi:H+-translocating diphosphatase
MGAAFVVAFRAGCVMGFSLVSLALLVLTIIIIVYRALYGNISNIQPGTSTIEWNLLYDCVAGYGLGGSTVALFGRVGGGIYTKAADVGADLVGKVEHDLPEDSPKNPATIADNVGDNVGDIAGMGADLFGSFAESTCAALVLSSTSIDIYRDSASMYYPLIVSAFGLMACFVTSFFATNVMKVVENYQIERTLKFQLLISTILLTPALYGAAAITLPDDYYLLGFKRQPVHAWICTVVGLWAGLIIGKYFFFFFFHV